ncbi:sulfotransferase [Aureococcus anophagefferens]|uniref:Sulfotransferase n=1 Tax=Aureococcus anophagefferens TaxID=44056 RepID=A0ABR1GB73_AURAN|nr:sulfotransferase [Aureococcus anophagefferens]
MGLFQSKEGDTLDGKFTTAAALKAKVKADHNCKRRWKDLPVPPFFNDEAAEAFEALETRADDVILASPMKAGTTYPDALPMTTPWFPSFMGGFLSYADLVALPEPRLFTTHFPGRHLPATLTDPEHGQGRLVLVLRNPKDMCASLHFFRGEAKDGWLGNEHGPGSIARFCAPDSPNPYGSFFTYVNEAERVAAPLIAKDRCLVVYYERLKLDLHAELERIAAFLRCPLPPAKRDALAAAVSFSSMAGNHMATRKGEIGDWKNHLTDAEWAPVDEAVAARLADSKLYEPLAEYARR